jgi:general secretion pathway protein C
MDRGRGSYAVIEDKKATGQNLYRVGDRVQDALIKMILREGVVLDVGGKDEILQIEEMAAASGGVRTPTVAAPAESLAPGSEPVARDVSLDRQTIEEPMGNVAELMKQVRIRPFFEGGKPAGLSLAGVAPSSIFEQMGISNSDVLQAVDGQPIQTVDDIVNLYQSLSNAHNLAIQVRRGGRVEDIQYKIE